jgi:dephospho-CoA kinase
LILLGLTGSIAMGKSHVATLFNAFGAPVFDSDRAVHALFRPRGAAVGPVLAAFPGCADEAGGIDRRCLGRMVLGDTAALRRLERIVHPLVRMSQQRFLERQCRNHRWLVVLDIPLLLETRGERRVDFVAVVSAHGFIQRQRALRRPGLSEERLEAILAQQMPDAQKRKHADFVIPSGYDRGATAAAVSGIIRVLTTKKGAAWPARWLRSASGGHG